MRRHECTSNSTDDGSREGTSSGWAAAQPAGEVPFRFSSAGEQSRIWGRGAALPRVYFDSPLPALFTRTLTLETPLPEGSALDWIFTGDEGGFTVTIAPGKVRVAQRYYDSFGLSAALGALAGCVISPITMTHYEMGAPLAIKGFAAAILGGLGNPMAAVLGGLLVGVLEAFSVSRWPAAYNDVAAFVVLLGVIFVRPHGLFGRPGAESVREH